MSSATENRRLNSPSASLLDLLNCSPSAASPEKHSHSYNQYTISIKSCLTELKQKSPKPLLMSGKGRSTTCSPDKERVKSCQAAKATRSDIKLRLEDYKQKISRINGMFFGPMASAKEIPERAQQKGRFLGDHQNFEKIHYKSEKNSECCTSETKSLNSNGSTQVSEHEEGTYKILTLKGQREFFKVIRFINQGCYGKVFLVQHAATNFICCLKVIRKEGLDQQIRNQITREIAIQTFLHHPNIVAIYGFSHDEENVYLLLEPCLGGNLYDKITKEDPSEKEVATSVREACFALDFMHENDIIHRDIKPENILLHEGTAKVCDFGWAVHSPLLRNTQCGTPIYLSPEVVGSELYDTKVDVWSIGILTYELLYKKIPFEIKSLSDLTKIMHEDVQFSSERDVSSCAKDFIQRCLCKNPRRRLSIGEALDQNFLVGNHLKYRQTIA